MNFALIIIESGIRRAKKLKAGAKRRVLIVGLMVLSMLGFAVVAQGGVQGSKHDLSRAGGAIGVCAFCHTPHMASSVSGVKPLWNRSLQAFGTYTMYDSPTMSSHPGAGSVPSTVSLMCLGCHDGINSTAAETPGKSKHTLLNIGGSQYTFTAGDPASNPDPNVDCTKCHDALDERRFSLIMGWTWSEGSGIFVKDLVGGINLTDDHPISVTYPATSQFITASGGKVDILPLYNNKVECASCHDPHNTTFGLFLRKSNSGSQLCLTCHNK